MPIWKTPDLPHWDLGRLSDKKPQSLLHDSWSPSFQKREFFSLPPLVSSSSTHFSQLISQIIQKRPKSGLRAGHSEVFTFRHVVWTDSIPIEPNQRKNTNWRLYFSNERGFSVESSLQRISSKFLLWKRNDSSVVL